jgi:L-2,4-diaminobutyric acid acetyltransferase
MSSKTSDIILRMPAADEGYAIHRLIADSPPLDLNTVYSYYLLSKHFSETCVVAAHEGRVAGFLSAYLIPKRADALFVWQVVVSKELRGQRVAWRMLEALLERLDGQGLQYVEATVNPSNAASRGLFERLARKRGTQLEEELFLGAEAFGPAGDHESEILLRIPL